MPIQLFWDDDDKTILRAIYEGTVTDTEYYESFVTLEDLERDTTHGYDLIVDGSQMKAFRGDYVNTIRYAEQHFPARLQRIVWVQAPSAVRVALQVAQRVLRHKIRALHFADSLEKAYEILTHSSE